MRKTQSAKKGRSLKTEQRKFLIDVNAKCVVIASQGMDSLLKLRYVFNGLRILCAYTFISGLHYQRRISEPLYALALILPLIIS
jgi:hypothetical protein